MSIFAGLGAGLLKGIGAGILGKVGKSLVKNVVLPIGRDLLGSA